MGSGKPSPDHLKYRRLPAITAIDSPFWAYRFQLTEDWLCSWTNKEGEACRLLVPSGTITDGSTEWVVFGLFPGWFIQILGLSQVGTHIGAAVGHDDAYKAIGFVPYEVFLDGEWKRRLSPLTRRESDYLFLDKLRTEALRYRGVRRWFELRKARMRWLGVRLGSWPVWLRRQIQFDGQPPPWSRWGQPSTG